MAAQVKPGVAEKDGAGGWGRSAGGGAASSSVAASTRLGQGGRGQTRGVPPGQEGHRQAQVSSTRVSPSSRYPLSLFPLSGSPCPCSNLEEVKEEVTGRRSGL
jgi:hypothetical protein